MLRQEEDWYVAKFREHEQYANIRQRPQLRIARYNSLTTPYSLRTELTLIAEGQGPDQSERQAALARPARDPQIQGPSTTPQHPFSNHTHHTSHRFTNPSSSSASTNSPASTSASESPAAATHPRSTPYGRRSPSRSSPTTRNTWTSTRRIC